MPSSRPQHIIEWKIPLWGLVTGAIGIVGLAISSWAGQRDTAKELVTLQGVVTELRAEVKQGNGALSKMTAEQALMTFRLQTLESDVTQLKGSRR